MFHYISGRAELVEPSLVVLDVQGVGYAINTSFTSASATKRGEQVRFYTYLHVKEDIFELYGFSSQEELSFFKQLLSVSGVGAKAAVSILSVASPGKLALAIVSGDEKLITQANGIGKKIAQRVILELRDKVAKGGVVPQTDGVSLGNAFGAAAGGPMGDALAALEVLGYPKAVILQALGNDPVEGLGTEEIIRLALKKLM